MNRKGTFGAEKGAEGPVPGYAGGQRAEGRGQTRLDAGCSFRRPFLPSALCPLLLSPPGSSHPGAGRGRCSRSGSGGGEPGPSGGRGPGSGRRGGCSARGPARGRGVPFALGHLAGVALQHLHAAGRAARVAAAAVQDVDPRILDGENEPPPFLRLERLEPDRFDRRHSGCPLAHSHHFAVADPAIGARIVHERGSTSPPGPAAQHPTASAAAPALERGCLASDGAADRQGNGLPMSTPLQARNRNGGAWRGGRGVRYTPTPHATSISVSHLIHWNPRRSGATRRSGKPWAWARGSPPTWVARRARRASSSGSGQR